MFVNSRDNATLLYTRITDILEILVEDIVYHISHILIIVKVGKHFHSK